MKIALVGGSGLGAALGLEAGGHRHELSTPFGKPSDAIVETDWAGVPVLLLQRHGPGHLLNPSQVPYRANLFALKQLGCTHIIASGAVGSLREHVHPRDLVIVDQVIDKTYRRAGTFYEQAAVHVELADPFCPVLRKLLIDAGKELAGSEQSAVGSETKAMQVHASGCYVCMEGPGFSTRAESLMHRLWGGDVIGMTAMPEAKLAREAEISYAMVALVTDYDCWRPHAPPAGDAAKPPDASALLQEIIGHLQAATSNAMALIRRAVELAAGRQEELLQAPAQRALQLAIWSDKAKISPDEVQRLGPLWMRYFVGEENPSQ